MAAKAQTSQIFMRAEEIYKEVKQGNPNRTLYVKRIPTSDTDKWLHWINVLASMPYMILVEVWVLDHPVEKDPCDGKIVEIEGKKYTLKAVE